ncbi:hypothetical protein [Paenalkalicoccus suaedae]|uniref:hypothetical protein n=1 Tax=Paenalkalicoccus suaedae TaxID=2592382 RepID=UPI00201C57F5|nr:hypothetical protein [Paenalkalicoccus suaedae]
MNKTLFLPLNLQYFAEEPAAEPQAPGAGEPTPEQPTQEDQSQSQEPTEKGGELSADEAKKMAEAEFLKSLGVDNFDTLKNTLAKHKEWEESQKTESEKLNDKLKRLSHS